MTAARRILRFERSARSPRGRLRPPRAGLGGEHPVTDTNAPGPMSSRRLGRLTAAILAAGFASALVIFVTAGPPASNPLGYEPLETKKYIHDLELYGGTANVLAEEFRVWFAGLWHGRNLAYTVAVLTALVVLAVRFFAAHPPLPDDEVEVDASSPRPDS
jgi:hypothetical protein